MKKIVINTRTHIISRARTHARVTGDSELCPTNTESQDGTRIVKDFFSFIYIFPRTLSCCDIAMASTYIKDETGTFIPASQRPDGTWRKQRRVKDGYIPQEEVPLYESKGKQLVKKPLYPVGASPEFIAEHKAKLEALAAKNKVIPGTQARTQEGSKKKKKKSKSKAVEPVAEGLSKITISEPEFHKEIPVHNDKQLSNVKQNTTNSIIKDNSNTTQKTTTDPQKKLKNLRKKMREIEVLEDKIKTGALKNPDKEILDKVARKTEISKEIKRLESAL